MIVSDAIVRGDCKRLLGFDPSEHPVALQIGGCDPAALSEAALLGEDFGYDEINLNVGCPSDRVQSGAFGACLMKTPALVAEGVFAMQSKVRIPVTVKCRLGVDDQDPAESLFGFIETVAAAGCRVFIVHARKAWLDGLSPQQNREIPPLDYEIVRHLKKARPDLTIVLNGGLASIGQALTESAGVDGVMLGRAAYGQPGILAIVDREFFGDLSVAPVVDDVVEAMSAYVRRCADDGVRPHHVVRHMLGLYHGQPGARLWRRLLSQQGAATAPSVLDEAIAAMRRSYCTRSTA